MKNTFMRIFAALLMLCLLLGAASCGGAADTSHETTQPNTPAGADVGTDSSLESAASVSFALSQNYVLVRPDEPTDDQEIKALQLLGRGIKSAYGFNCALKTDFTRPNTKFVPAEFEILVGPTNRPESVAISEQLSYYDWTYSIVSPNVIAICGGSPEATYEAVKAFLSEVLGYQEKEDESIKTAGSAVSLEVGTLKNYTHKYGASTIKLGNRDIKEYTLVAKSVNAKGISDIIDAVERLTGNGIKVVAAEDFTGGPAIYFGCANANGSHLDITPYGNSRYYITESGEDIIIDFKASGAASGAAARFVEEYIPDKGVAEIVVELGRPMMTGIYISKGTNSLALDEVKSSEVAAGITYEERLYYDPDGKPVRAYILVVDKGAGIFYTSTPSDGTTTGKVSNIQNQIKAAVENGKNVIAGVNADFFDMGGTNVMRGLCIKEGKVMTGTGDRPWFGITTDGEPVVGTAAEYSKYEGKLVTAVGGSHIMLRNDSTSSLGVGTEFGDTRHPRTAVGVRPDGGVVIMVVDGRQSSISNGASLADLAEIFATFGCDNAINLDGGGSTTFVLKNSKGAFVVENSPSGGSLRSVANGLLVLAP